MYRQPNDKERMSMQPGDRLLSIFNRRAAYEGFNVHSEKGDVVKQLQVDAQALRKIGLSRGNREEGIQ